MGIYSVKDGLSFERDQSENCAGNVSSETVSRRRLDSEDLEEK